MQVLWAEDAERVLLTLPPADADRIVDAVEALAESGRGFVRRMLDEREVRLLEFVIPDERNSAGDRPTGGMRTVLCSLLVLSMATPALAQIAPEYHTVVGARAPVTKIDQPVPAGFHREHRFNWTMFATGLGTFALSYGISAAFSSILADKGGSVMAIPFVGPFLMMANVQEAGSGCNSSKVMCLPADSRSKMMSALGSEAAFQFVGFGFFVASFFTGSTVVVRDSKPLVSNVHVAPVVTGRFTGVSLSGSF